MEKDELVRRLMSTFLGELEEHVRAINRGALALEKESAPEVIATLFRTAHSLKGAARSVGAGPIEAACHILEDLLTGLRERRLAPAPDLFQLLFSAADAIQDAGARLKDGRDLRTGPLAALMPRLEAAARPAGGLVRLGPEPPVPTAPAAESSDFVRVRGENLDALAAASGELRVALNRADARIEEVSALLEFADRWQAEWMLAPKATGVAATEATEERLQRLRRALHAVASSLAADARAVDQAAAPLEERVRRLRMLPFGEACEGLERLVRDLSRGTDKAVELSVKGSDVELDRSLIEKLKDPLTHLVRNAVDHGIEPPAIRRGAGKPETGRVTVSAALRGSRVEVTVEDDGKGLDLKAIADKARVSRASGPGDARDLAELIFTPGFSTAPTVTEVSGRGIGLDVVKSRVESLHGSVEFSFEAGRGARFVLSLPLTLTTVRALLVSEGGQLFAVLGVSVQKLRRVGAADLRSVEGREIAVFGDTPVPVSSLADVLGLRAERPRREGGRVPILLLSSGGLHAAFAVDELVAEQEIVVKPLGPRLRRVKHVGGTTILPTGRLALVLNAGELVRSAVRRPPARPVAAAFAAPAPAARKRLLVVDDSVTTRTLLRSILESAGFDVRAAADGAEAWHALQEHGADLVVADVEMPRMDGFVLTEAIRGSPRFRELPVILVTALESDKDKTRGVEAGANAYLPKGAFDQARLLETIGQLI